MPIWIFGLICAALGGLVTTATTKVASNWINTDHIADSLATDPPVALVDAYSQHHSEWGWATPRHLTSAQVSKMSAFQDPDTSSDPDGSKSENFDANLGAIPVGQQSVDLTLRGNRAEPVNIVDAVPIKYDCVTQTPQTLVANIPQGDNATPNLWATMDDRRPRWTSKPLTKGSTFHAAGAADYFDGHHVSLAKDEEQTLHFTVVSSGQTCSWYLQTRELVDGKPVVQKFGENSNWRVSGAPARMGSYKQLLISRYWAYNAMDGNIGAFVSVTPSDMCAILNNGYSKDALSVRGKRCVS